MCNYDFIYLDIEFSNSVFQASGQVVTCHLELIVGHFAGQHTEVCLVGHRLHHIFSIQFDGFEEFDLLEKCLKLFELSIHNFD